MPQCIIAIISGKVQGVYFRASTKKKAVQLHLTGHAKNLSDGTVEVMAQGTHDGIEQLLKWLQRGPVLAKVNHVDWKPHEPGEQDDFRIT